MNRISFTRIAGAALAASTMVLATSLTSSAAAPKASLNATDAALVPSALKNVTWPVSYTHLTLPTIYSV